MKITIAISNLDCRDHLRRCLQSIGMQTRRPDRCILIDDGSTDGAGAVMIEEADAEKSRVILSPWRGVQKQRNLALGMAGGDAIAFLDSDAFYFPHYLSRLEDALAANPKAGIAYCRWYWIRKDGSRLPQNSPSVFDREKLLRSNYVSMCSLFRLEALREYGFDESLPCYHDWDVVLGITGNGWSAAFVNEPLFEAALRPNGITMRRDSSRAHEIREKHNIRERKENENVASI